MSKQVGYIRVSTKGQNTARQEKELEKYVPADMIVIDKASGKDFNRPGYQSLKIGIGKLVKGDTLYIKSLDRLGRNKEETKKELEYFKNEGVRVKVLDIPTTLVEIPNGQEWILDMINNILIEVLASVAENERKTTRQRQREGIDAMPVGKNGKKYSKKTGNPIGRPEAEFPENWEEVYTIWKDKQITAVEAMQRLGLKKNSFYKLVKKYELQEVEK